MADFNARLSLGGGEDTTSGPKELFTCVCNNCLGGEKTCQTEDKVTIILTYMLPSIKIIQNIYSRSYKLPVIRILLNLEFGERLSINEGRVRHVF